MKRWNRVALVIGCCAALAACKSPDATATQGSVDPSTCRSHCDSAYDNCAYTCEQDVDSNMCPSECADRLDGCKKSCR